MKRIIAIDYGDARTGVAVSDLTGTLAGEALTIQEWNAEKLAQRLAFFARERGAASGLPVTLWDERRSTIEAHAILHAAGKKEKKHRANVDAVAATLLLEGYLASPNR